MLEVKVRGKFNDTRTTEDIEEQSLEDYLKYLDIVPKNGKIYGYLTGDYIVGPVIEATEEYINHEYWVKIIPETIQLYTNMNDSQGTPLYQGDVVSVTPAVPGDLENIPGYKEGDTGTIVWLEGGWMVMFKDTAIKLWQETLLFTKVGETDEA